MARDSLHLRSMSVDALLELRDDIGAMLSTKRLDLKRQLQRLEGGKLGRSGDGAARSHPRKGMKVAPKYRGPDGETWAGRGATPKWLTALTKEGHRPEEFLIDRSEKALPKQAKKAARKGTKRGKQPRHRIPAHAKSVSA